LVKPHSRSLPLSLFLPPHPKLSNMAEFKDDSELTPKELDFQRMIAAEVHIGTKIANDLMKDYIWVRRQDNVHVLNIGKTYDKIMLAAKVIAAVDNPADVCAISARPYGQRSVLKFAQFTGCSAIAGRFTPGTFTNQITNKYMEPRLLLLTDPRTDHQAISEAAYANIPTIAFCDTDSPLKHIDVAIPANNKGKHSIGLLYWMLAREVLRLRGTINRMQPWDVMVDLSFYRDPEEVEEQAKQEAAAREAPAEVMEAVPPPPTDWDTPAAPVAASGEWGAPPVAPPMQPTAEWGAAVPAAPMGGDWGAQDTNWN